MAALGYGSWLVPAAGAGGLAASVLLATAVRSRPSGNDAMTRCGAALRLASRTFQLQSLRLLAPLAALLLLVLAWHLGPGAALSFALGALLASAAAVLAVGAVDAAGVRTAQALREAGGPRARTLAHAGGGAAGLAVAGLGLAAAGTAHVLFSSAGSASDLAGLALGASCVSLAARGGDVLAKASERAAELLARLDRGAEGPSWPLAQAGETAGGAGGGAADLFASVAAALAAAVVVGADLASPAAAAFPLLLAVAGLLGSAAAAAGLAFAPLLGSPRVQGLLPLMPAGAVALAGAGLGALLPLPAGSGVAAVLGALLGPALGAAARYYASRRPVARLAESSQLGPAANVLSGLASGLEGAVAPAVLAGLALLGAAGSAGSYGVAVCAAALVSCSGLLGGLGAFAPIASQARGIAARVGLGADVREMAEALHAEGLTHSARARGFAAGATALAAAALFVGYVTLSGLTAVNLGRAQVLVGLILGAALPFLVSALSLGAAGEVAFELVAQARRLAGGDEQGAARVREASRAALGRTVVPTITALLVPLAVGLGLGAEALGGLLAGAIASGALLSFALADAGDVWRGGRSWIEAGALGGVGSDAHRAALVGDAVGEPLKDVAGPAVQTLVKALAAVSLALAPLLPHA